MIHYIPNTENRYSITESGIVTAHYRLSYTKVKVIIKCNRIIKHNRLQKSNKPSINILFAGSVQRNISINSAIYQAHGFTKCRHCNIKLYGSVCKKNCDTCVTKLKEERRKLAVLNITKAYSAAVLQISISKLPDNLHKLHASKLQIKRLIKSKQNELQTT